MSRIAGGIDGLEAVFDDASLVGDAGLLLAGTDLFLSKTRRVAEELTNSCRLLGVVVVVV